MDKASRKIQNLSYENVDEKRVSRMQKGLGKKTSPSNKNMLGSNIEAENSVK